MKAIFSLILFLSMNFYLKAQLSEMHQGLQKTLPDVLLEVDKKYESIESRQGKNYKHYMRMRSDLDYKLTPGEPVKNYNWLNYQAFNKEQKRQTYANLGRQTHGQWENLGPYDYYGSDAWSGGGVGRINCTAFHPTDPNTMWVGAAAGGLWKTIDGGTTWTPMTDHFPSIGISDIAVHPTNPNIIYILTGDGDAAALGLNPFVPFTSAYPGPASIGIMKTEDGGLTWEQTGMGFTEAALVNGCRLLIHPANPDILLVGLLNTGIFRSSNGGVNWTSVFGVVSVWDMEFQPGNPQVVYAASSNGFVKSTDGGVTWAIDNDPSFPASTWARLTLAISPSAPQNVYLLFGDSAPAGSFGGLYKSTDAGSSFNLMSNTPNILANDMGGGGGTPQAAYNQCMAVDPTNDNRIFVGAINCWKSEDGGITWGRETWWTRSFADTDPYVHADFHNMYFNGNTLFVNNDGGIYKTNDYGHSWTELSSGLSLMMFYEIDILNNEWLGGSQDNGTNGTNFSDPQCHQLWGGDGFAAVWHTGNNTIQYISSQNAIYRRQFGTSVPISPIELGNGDFWNCEIEMHTTDPDYVFASTRNEIYRGNGNNFEFTWDSLGTWSFLPGPGERVFGFSQCVSDPTTMYVVSQNNILRTNNLDQTAPSWTPLSSPVAGGAFISNVVVNPTDTAEVWITCSGYANNQKVYYSNNNGNSWTNISGTLPNIPIRCIAYQPGSNDGLYIGTDIGMYYRNNTIGDWIYFSNHFPNTIVRDIELNGTHVFAGTYGRGIWRSELYSTCQTDLVLTPLNDPGNPLSVGEQHYAASNSITSTRELKGGFAEIIYSAGNFIDMKPGFLAEKNNFMIAKPDGCPD